MDSQYPLPLGVPLGVYYPTGYPPMLPPELYHHELHQMPLLSVGSLGGYAEYDELNRGIIAISDTTPTRRSRSGSEHVKHRRTRSGCFTCRLRRVKCDETRPMCERCRKGKRKCSFPAPSTQQSRPGKRDSSSDSASEDDTDEKMPLSSIPDDEEFDLEDEKPPTLVDSRRPSLSSGVDFASSPPLASLTLARTPARPTTSRTSSKDSIQSNLARSSRWTSLPKDVKFYLQFFKDHITRHHYAFKRDDDGFVQTTLLEIALADETSALLYGMVAFAAYHYAVSQPDGQIATFLSYYNKSITFLQHALLTPACDGHSVATLLTILQLAAIEEHLGDWVNLLGHQRAAFQIFTELFTLDNIMRDETSRRALAWYLRFDIFAGFMSGGEMTLSREWPAVMFQYYEQQALRHPQDKGACFDALFAEIRVLAADVALLFATRIKGATEAQYRSEYRHISGRLAALGEKINAASADDATRYVTSFPRAPPPGDADITDFRDPHFLFAGELSTLNFVLMDYWAIELTLRYRACHAEGCPPSPACTTLALKIAKMFEAIEYGDEGAAGGILGAQASLGIAALSLPKDAHHTTWLRRKFARVEQQGYTYSSSFRERMSGVLGIDVSTWWLPDDEGRPAILRQMRDFVDYRGTQPTDEWSVGVRDMTGWYKSLNVSSE